MSYRKTQNSYDGVGNSPAPAPSVSTKKCGKEGHFSHSSGGGKFSWSALRLNAHKYLFIMFETYIDGTSDHYITGVIDIPTMTSDLITANGKPGILYNKNFTTVSVPDNKSIPIINKALKNFFDSLPCYSGPYSGRGVQ